MRNNCEFQESIINYRYSYENVIKVKLSQATIS